MKKIIPLLSLLVSFYGLSGFISSEFTTTSLTSQNYKLMLGEFSLEELKSTKNKDWFDTEYKRYNPKPEVVEEISEWIQKNDYKIEVYMGTWCPDSRIEFPHFIKILNQANFDLEDLTIVGVDRDKVVPNVTEEKRKQLNIKNVPTIIVYDAEGKEMNRYVEFAQESLEKDFLKILSGQDYKHVYDF